VPVFILIINIIIIITIVDVVVIGLPAKTEAIKASSVALSLKLRHVDLG